MDAEQMELKKAFSELQAKSLETTQKVRLARGQIEALKRSCEHAKLTGKEIEGLPSGTRTYETIGRMFILVESKEVMEHLQKDQEETKEKVKGLEANIAYWEKSLKDSEENIRDMLQRKR